MGPSIGFIVPELLVAFAKSLTRELAPSCTLRILPARRAGDAAALYRGHLDEVDCFAVAGQTLYGDILREEPTPAKPCHVMDERKGDIKEALLKLLLRDRALDLTRVYIDFAAPLNNFLGLKELLPRDRSPRFAAFTLQDPFRLEERILAEHLDLHARGEVDISVTGFAGIARDLEAAGIPFMFLNPSREYAIHFFMRIADAAGRPAEGADHAGAPAPEVTGTVSDERLIALSRAYHVDSASLRKIIACAQRSDAPAISTDDLAAFMGIAKRSAGRLLNKLEEHGGATCHLRKLSGGRGRPEKFYALTFLQDPDPAPGA